MIDKIFNTIPIKGHFCHLYPVEISDAKFIYDLRTQSGGDFLKKIGPSVDDQTIYLKKYMVFENIDTLYAFFALFP